MVTGELVVSLERPGCHLGPEGGYKVVITKCQIKKKKKVLK